MSDMKADLEAHQQAKGMLLKGSAGGVLAVNPQEGVTRVTRGGTPFVDISVPREDLSFKNQEQQALLREVANKLGAIKIPKNAQLGVRVEYLAPEAARGADTKLTPSGRSMCEHFERTFPYDMDGRGALLPKVNTYKDASRDHHVVAVPGYYKNADWVPLANKEGTPITIGALMRDINIFSPKSNLPDGSTSPGNLAVGSTESWFSLEAHGLGIANAIHRVWDKGTVVAFTAGQADYADKEHLDGARIAREDVVSYIENGKVYRWLQLAASEDMTLPDLIKGWHLKGLSPWQEFAERGEPGTPGNNFALLVLRDDQGNELTWPWPSKDEQTGAVTFNTYRGLVDLTNLPTGNQLLEQDRRYLAAAGCPPVNECAELAAYHARLAEIGDNLIPAEHLLHINPVMNLVQHQLFVAEMRQRVNLVDTAEDAMRAAFTAQFPDAQVPEGKPLYKVVARALKEAGLLVKGEEKPTWVLTTMEIPLANAYNNYTTTLVNNFGPEAPMPDLPILAAAATANRPGMTPGAMPGTVPGPTRS